MRVTNYLDWLDCSCYPAWHPLSPTVQKFQVLQELCSLISGMISDATDDRSEVACFLGGGEVLLTLFGPAERSSNRTVLLCGNTAYSSFVGERRRYRHRWAIFTGDDLAV
jgi:hypothetical protein